MILCKMSKKIIRQNTTKISCLSHSQANNYLTTTTKLYNTSPSVSVKLTWFITSSVICL